MLLVFDSLLKAILIYYFNLFQTPDGTDTADSTGIEYELSKSNLLKILSAEHRLEYLFKFNVNRMTFKPYQKYY